MITLVGILLLGIANASNDVLAPLVSPSNSTRIINDKYIVVMKPSSEIISSQSLNPLEWFTRHETWLTTRLASSPESNLKHVYDMDELKGYAGHFSPELVDDIRQRPEVAYVERDQVMQVLRTPLLKPKGLQLSRAPIFGKAPSSYREPRFHSPRYPTLEQSMINALSRWFNKDKRRAKTISRTDSRHQYGAPWGLVRLSHKKKPLFFDQSYGYPPSAGKRVNVYVIDTGINIDHKEFGGRASWGKTIPLDDEDIDGNGHGTHCAGIIGSKTYGVAKQARLIAVKVLSTSGFGSNSDVIAGINWVIQQHRKATKIAERRGKPAPKSVANMSLGGGRSLALETVVNRAVREGIHFAVAAGNDNEDACEYSPAAASLPITVGASTIDDSMAVFSNHGKCVDIFAPGLDIKSTWIGSEEATNTISGTSMASPHVAGVLALYLADRDLDPSELKKLIIRDAAKNSLARLPPATKNRLACTRSLLLTS